MNGKQMTATVKKVACAATVAGAVGGCVALGVGAGSALADPKLPSPPIPPIPAPPIPHVDVPAVHAPHVPDVAVPPVQAPNMPPVTVPGVTVPPVQLPAPGTGGLPDPLRYLPDAEDFFGVPGTHIPPGQLMNAASINGVPNPFYGIPPGRLKNMPTVQGMKNPFFDEVPGHWQVPEQWLPDVDDYFGLTGANITPVQLKNTATINGIPNPYFGIPAEQLRKMPTVQGYENPFFEQLPGHWQVP